MIDAASAAEIVLHRVISTAVTAGNMPNSEYRRRLERLDKQQPLGELVAIIAKADVDLDVDTDAMQKLVDLRNDAIHRGLAPNSREAYSPVQAVLELLGRHGPWKRSGEEPQYGDEWEPVDPEASA